MKKLFCVLLALIAYTQADAQTAREAGLQTINRSTAEAHVRFLADDLLEGREAGTRGGKIAARYVASSLQAMGVKPLIDSTYMHTFEVRSKKRVQIDSLVIEPDSVMEIERIISVSMELANVIGKIDGQNPDECIVVGAHYDHLGVNNAMEGDGIFNGADDNASGVSAVLQIARAFCASGVKPERTIIFALWDGEEKRLLGSNFFVETFDSLSRVKCYMNFDMIGRNKDENNPWHVDYFYTDTHPQYGDWLRQDIEAYGFSLQPNYRPWDMPTQGSDNASFARNGIPIIWYHTDGHADYHRPSDHADKLNWEKLVEITQTAYLLVWRLANE